MDDMISLEVKLNDLQTKINKIMDSFKCVEGLIIMDSPNAESLMIEFSALQDDIISTKLQISAERCFEKQIEIFRNFRPFPVSRDAHMIVLASKYLVWKIAIGESRFWLGRSLDGTLFGPTQSVFQCAGQICEELDCSDGFISPTKNLSKQKMDWENLSQTSVSKMQGGRGLLVGTEIWEICVRDTTPFFVGAYRSDVIPRQRFKSLTEAFAACKNWESIEHGWRPGPLQPIPYWKRRKLDPDHGLKEILAQCDSMHDFVNT